MLPAALEFKVVALFFQISDFSFLLPPFSSLLVSSLLFSFPRFRSSVDSVDEPCTAPFITRLLWPTYLYRVINYSYSRSIRSIRSVSLSISPSVNHSYLRPISNTSDTYNTYFKYVQYIHQIHQIHQIQSSILSGLSVPTLLQRYETTRNQKTNYCVHCWCSILLLHHLLHAAKLHREPKNVRYASLNK